MSSKIQDQVSMVMLYIDSQGFMFEAFGRDRKEAQEVLLAGWIAHRNSLPFDAAKDLPGPSLDELLQEFDIGERYISTGSFYRDREPVKIGPVVSEEEVRISHATKPRHRG